MKVLGMGTIEVSWARGPNHRMQEEMAVLVQYGEVEQLGQARPVPGKPWLVEIPYRRLAPAGSARKGRRRRLALLWGGGLGVYVLTALWMLWESRYVVLAAVGTVVALAATWAVVKAVTGRCPGLHCPGCGCR